MTDQAGRGELHYAALEGDVERVRQLLGEGCDPNGADLQGFTPLHFAAQSYAPSAVALLLESGAEVDRANGAGNTALSLAVFYSEGRGEVIEQLLEAGADPDRENNAGISPRVLAERIANYDVKRYLASETD
jgi:ankyrin repeat protein